MSYPSVLIAFGKSPDIIREAEQYILLQGLHLRIFHIGLCYAMEDIKILFQDVVNSQPQ